MVLAHAAHLRQQGAKVFTIINDSGGRRTAAELRLDCYSTVDLLRKAAQLGLITDRATMREIYERMQPHDWALPSIDTPEIRSRLLDRTIYGSQSDRYRARVATEEPGDT